jgi:hypothetical protein
MACSLVDCSGSRCLEHIGCGRSTQQVEETQMGKFGCWSGKT